MDKYIGMTEGFWKFATISFKGLFVAFAWPCWLFPIVVGSIVYVLLTILQCLIWGRTNTQMDNYDSLTESEGEDDEVIVIDSRKKDDKEGDGGEDSDTDK